MKRTLQLLTRVLHVLSTLSSTSPTATTGEMSEETVDLIKTSNTPKRRRFAGKARLGLVMVVLTLGLAAGVFAYFSGHGSGTAAASVGTLAAPTNVASTTAGTGTVSVNWTGINFPNAGTPQGYYVRRYSGSTPSTVGGSCGSPIAPISGTSCSDTSVADGTYTYTVVAVYRSFTSESSPSASVTVVNDNTPPFVQSINRADTSPTKASTVHWTVAFSENVSGVDSTDFTLVGAGATGASITGVSGGGTSYTVTASTGSDGALGLNLVDDNSIVDGANNPLGTSGGAGDGSFVGQTYVVDKTAPAIARVAVADATANTGGFVKQAGTYFVYAQVTDATTAVASVSADASSLTTGATALAMDTTGGPWTINGSSYNYRSEVQTAKNPLGESGNPYAFSVTAADTIPNSGTTSGSVAADNTGPAGGSVAISGLVGTGSAYSTSTTLSLSLSAGTDTGVGNASSSTFLLQRAFSGLTSAGTANGTCAAVGAFTTVATGPGATATDNAAGGIATNNCYRYRYVVTDLLGNQTTYTVPVDAKVDTSGPTVSAVAPGSATGSTSISGTTVYVNGQAGRSGSFAVGATAADTQSGVLKVNFPGLGAGFTGGGDTSTTPYSASYSWSGAVSGSSATVTATNNATLTNTGSFTLASDTTAPSGGVLTINSQAASAAGTTSTNSSGTISISRTDYTEATTATSSGLKSSVLTREDATYSSSDGIAAGTCGTYAAPVAVTVGTASQAVGTGCYRYTLTGTDNVGNAVSITTTVKVDKTGPGAVSVVASGASGNTSITGNTVYYNPQTGMAGSFTVTATSSDNDSGLLNIIFPSLAGFSAGGGTATTSPFSTTYTWSGTSGTASGSQTVTATNGVGSTTNGSFTVTPDTAAPTGGALTANSTAATAAGSVSYSKTGSYTGSRTDYTADAGSGVASSVLSKQTATLSAAGTCGTFGAASTIPTGFPAESSLAEGCYLYTLLGTDKVSNSASVNTVVHVDKTAPTISSLTLSNGGSVQGKIEPNDNITIVFSEQIAVGSLCSTWSGDTSNQSLTSNGDNVVLTLADGTGATNDSLSITSSTCTFHLGTIDLGSNNYVSGGGASFSGTGSNRTNITWTAATRTLNIMVGGKSGSGTLNTVASSTAIYTPSSLITDSAGNAVTGTGSSGAVKNF